jgi:hypothetical protein
MVANIHQLYGPAPTDPMAQGRKAAALLLARTPQHQLNGAAFGLQLPHEPGFPGLSTELARPSRGWVLALLDPDPLFVRLPGRNPPVWRLHTEALLQGGAAMVRGSSQQSSGCSSSGSGSSGSGSSGSRASGDGAAGAACVLDGGADGDEGGGLLPAGTAAAGDKRRQPSGTAAAAAAACVMPPQPAPAATLPHWATPSTVAAGASSAMAGSSSSSSSANSGGGLLETQLQAQLLPGRVALPPRQAGAPSAGGGLLETQETQRAARRLLETQLQARLMPDHTAWVRHTAAAALAQCPGHAMGAAALGRLLRATLGFPPVLVAAAAVGGEAAWLVGLLAPDPLFCCCQDEGGCAVWQLRVGLLQQQRSAG